MHFDETAEPVEWDLPRMRDTLQEWERVAAQLLTHLASDRACDRTANWHPHVDQIAKALQAFRDLCCAEMQQLGHWREDGLQPDEAYELVWDEADRLVHWLGRMIA